VRLFRDFRVEQTDPRRFYSALAEDSVGQLSAYHDLAGATLLDVGGGPGYFRDTFAAAGATYFALDADVGELSGQGGIAPGTVIGDGMRLPFADDSIDVCYSSNVLEHVPDRARMAEEMLRAAHLIFARLLDVVPRYNPRWSYWLTRVPLVRELVTWNLVIVVRKS